MFSSPESGDKEREVYEASLMSYCIVWTMGGCVPNRKADLKEAAARRFSGMMWVPDGIPPPDFVVAVDSTHVQHTPALETLVVRYKACRHVLRHAAAWWQILVCKDRAQLPC